MELAQALERWLGPLQECGDRTDPRLRQRDRSRAIFLGAGFTKASFADAPTFWDLMVGVRDRLVGETAADPTRDGLLAELRHPKWCERVDPGALFEALELHDGRLAILRDVLAEPHGSGFRLQAPATEVERPQPRDAAATFRTLKGWVEAMAARHLHLQPLRPGGAPVMLGRLVAEGATDEILTTNWDAFAELGCALAGFRILDEDDVDPRKAVSGPSRPVGAVRVYDRPSDVAVRSQPSKAAVIYKLHGGVRLLHKLLRSVATSAIEPAQADRELHGCFLIAASDLHLWIDAAQWVSYKVRDALLGRTVLFLGVSFADPALFEAVRERTAAWERGRAQVTVPGVPGTGYQVAEEEWLDEGPPLLAVDPELKLPLQNAMSFHLPQPGGGRALRVNTAAADGERALRAAFAWRFLQYLLGALDGDHDDDEAQVAGRLRAGLRSDLSQPEKPGSLVGLICDLFAPAARWAAIAEQVPPFADGVSAVPGYHADTAALVTPTSSFAAWWYAPWSRAPHAAVAAGGGCATCANLRLIAYVLDAVATVCATHAEVGVADDGEWLRWCGDGSCASRPLRLWLWPWPWPWRRGVLTAPLLRALNGHLGLAPPPTGRQPPAMTISPLAVLSPVQAAELSDVHSLVVGDVACPVVPPSDLLDLRAALPDQAFGFVPRCRMADLEQLAA